MFFQKQYEADQRTDPNGSEPDQDQVSETNLREEGELSYRKNPIRLTAHDVEFVQELMQSPPEPNDALRDLFAQS